MCVCVGVAADESDKIAEVIRQHQYQEKVISVVRGDYAPLMQNMITNLEKAKVQTDGM